MSNTTTMTANGFDAFTAQTTDRLLRELASDLADLVASGDLTETEANEWMVRKQDAWKDGQ